MTTKTLLAFLAGAASTYGGLYLLNEQPIKLNLSPSQVVQRVDFLLGGKELLPEQKPVTQPGELFAQLEVSEEKQNPRHVPDELGQFKALLAQHNYSHAFELYETKIKAGLEQAYIRPLYLHIFERVQSQPSRAKQLSEQSLALDYGNLYFHYLALLANIELTNYPKAFEHLIYMRDAYVPEALAEPVLLQQKLLIQAYTAELEVSQDTSQIQELIRLLEYLNELEMAAKLDAKLKALERQQYLGSLYPMQIPLKPMGKHHLVEVVLNGDVTVELLLDTGASFVAISKQTLEPLRYELVRQGVVFNSANGQHKADLVALESIRVGEIELTDFQVSTLDNYHSNGDAGLLGQSFLSLFDWKLDQENHLLYLAPK